MFFFFFQPESIEGETAPRRKGLADYAFLYTAGASGRNSGIRFMMTLEDAQAWCSSSLSRGILHGNPWAYFFTSVENFISCHWGTHKPELDLRKVKDHGGYDRDIAGLGLTKYNTAEIKDIRNPLGVKVLI